jgi:hypothetical protein
MIVCDWSSDVCSSDGKTKLGAAALPGFTAKGQKFLLPGVPAPEQ